LSLAHAVDVVARAKKTEAKTPATVPKLFNNLHFFMGFSKGVLGGGINATTQ
jgi:hypothetical protein